MKDICDYTPFNVKDNDEVITQSSHFDFYDIQDTVFNFNILGSKRLENLSRIQKLTGVSLSEIDILHSEILDAFKMLESVRKGLIFRNKVSEEHKLFLKEISSPLGENFFGFCSKVGYMFPKAHAIEYVIIALYYAWFKKHYPKEFKTVCLRDIKKYKTN